MNRGVSWFISRRDQQLRRPARTETALLSGRRRGESGHRHTGTCEPSWENTREHDRFQWDLGVIFVSFIPLSGIFMQPVTGKILNPFFLERDISISQTCYLQRRHGQGGFALLFLKFVHLKEKQHFGRGRTRLARLGAPRSGRARGGWLLPPFPHEFSVGGRGREEGRSEHWRVSPARLASFGKEGLLGSPCRRAHFLVWVSSMGS